jgi:hypothetical protein
MEVVVLALKADVRDHVDEDFGVAASLRSAKEIRAKSPHEKWRARWKESETKHHTHNTALTNHLQWRQQRQATNQSTPS